MGSPSCVHYYYGVMHSKDVAIGQEICHTLTHHIGGTITYVEDRSNTKVMVPMIMARTRVYEG